MRDASATVCVNGPAWSNVRDRGTMPSVEISPNDGFSPTMPQAAAGIRIDPPVHVPSVARAMPDATLPADPPLAPPGYRNGPWGLRAGPTAGPSLVWPNATSGRWVFPPYTSPARL